MFQQLPSLAFSQDRKYRNYVIILCGMISLANIPETIGTLTPDILDACSLWIFKISTVLWTHRLKPRP